MPRKQPPAYAPIDPTPAELSPEELCVDGALQVPEAAAFAGVGESTMRTMIREREVPSFKVRGRRVVPRKAIVLYLASQLRTQLNATEFASR